MQGVKVLLLCILSAIVYGILHDQVTVRVCGEYFTIGHPPLLATPSPALLALAWGVLGTWWVGLLLGVLAVLACRLGSWPRYNAAQLVRPIGGLLAGMGCCALLAGLIGYELARAGVVWLLEPLASQVPPEKQAAFVADLWAHVASYGSGLLGGLVLCSWVLLRRRQWAFRAGKMH